MFSLTGAAGQSFEGLGFAEQAFGAYESYQGAQGQYHTEENIAALQQQKNSLDANQMELNARRGQMEVIRNEQRARSLALSSSANQGAQFGSGLQGGYGQIAGQSGNNMLGINQNLRIGRQEEAVNQSLTDQQLAMGKYGGQSALGSGLSSAGSGTGSFGKDLVSIATNPSGSLFT